MHQKLFIVVISFVLFPLILLGNESKTYKIGCNENYYPYIVKNNETGDMEGIIIDWWNLWAEKSNVAIEFVPLDLQTCIQQTTTGEIDAVAGLFFSEERNKILDFTEPLVRMRTVLFMKKGLKSDSIGNISESIGVLKDDLAHVTLKDKYPELQLEVFDNIESMRDKIQHKTINAFVYDIPNSIRNYKTVKPPQGYYIFDTLYAEKLRAAVKSGNSEMFKLVLSGATKITDEEILTIAEKYDLFNPDRTWLWIVIIVALFIGVVIALFITHFFSSKKKIAEMEEYVSKTDWKLIIDKGESDKIEFKSSLRWDYRLEKANKVLEKVIAKTISAFLNTDGGILFIGVDDDGNILGLDKDYSCVSKNNRDGFLLALTTIINVHLGKSSHKFVSINIISINEKDVCIVNVESSDKPVFMGKNDNEEFYIRASASSQPLGVRETYKYINSRWK